MMPNGPMKEEGHKGAEPCRIALTAREGHTRDTAGSAEPGVEGVG